MASNQTQPDLQQHPPAVPQLPKHKVKIKLHLQRSCNEKDEKGKLCAGHFKRWFYASDILEQECGDVEKAYGRDAEVYRCEYCRTLYLPNPADPRNESVAGRGKVSEWGFNTPPKNGQ